MTVSYLARTNCRSWVKRQFAAPTIRGILGVELPSPDMTVPVTKLSFTGGGPTGRSVFPIQPIEGYLSATKQAPRDIARS